MKIFPFSQNILGLILLCDMFVYRLFSYVRKIKIFQKGISLLLIPLLHCIFFGKNEIICRLLSFSMKYFLAASSWSTPSSFYPPPQSSAKRSGRDLLPGLPKINWRKKLFPSIQGKALRPLVAALHPLPLLCLLVEGQVYQETAFVLHQVCVFLFVHLYWGTCISVFVFLYLPCCFSWEKGDVCWQSENLVCLVCLLEIVSGT